MTSDTELDINEFINVYEVVISMPDLLIVSYCVF